MANKNDISDELLAAYLDGNTTEAETRQVLNAIKADPELRETLDIALSLDENDTQFEEIVLPMLKIAADSGDNICSVLCEAYILHRREIPFEEQELLSIAQDNHWLKPEGTPLHAIGQLLVHYGLMITHKYDATIEDLEKALSLDNDVIVVVDSDKLFPDREDREDEPNHAIVVTGVDSVTVEIYDPQKCLMFNVQRSTFLRAWAESSNYMIRVLQSADDYEPQPVNLSEIQLTEELSELQEAIAENAHDVWAAARIREGWSYGTKRDDANKKHPDLIPYSALPDSEKDYDRLMALDTIKLVKKLGFDIVKRNK